MRCTGHLGNLRALFVDVVFIFIFISHAVLKGQNSTNYLVNELICQPLVKLTRIPLSTLSITI